MLEKKNYQYLKPLPANFQDSLVVHKDRWQRGKLIRTGCVSIHKMVGVKKSKPKKNYGSSKHPYFPKQLFPKFKLFL